MEMKLKSKAMGIGSYTDVDISGFLPAFTVDQERLKQDLQRVLKQYGKKENASEVKKGDLILLSCQSTEPRFCKKSIPVQVGKGLFHKQLETALEGISSNEEVTIMVDETAVLCNVLKITRTIYPELTDEVVASWKDERFSNVKEVESFCIEKQIVRFLDDCDKAEEASAMVWQTVANQGEFVLDEEELETVVQELRVALENASAQECMEDCECEAEENEEVSEDVECENLSEDIDIAQMIGESELKSAAIGQYMMEQEGKNVTMEDYEVYLSKRRREGETRQEVEARYPLFLFLKETYAEHFAVAIDSYVQKYFLTHLNPFNK